MNDPYFDVKAEVETSLHSLSTQLSSYLRLKHSAPSDQLQWSLSELKATLVSLENDLEELDESVCAVEEPGVARRLSVALSEVAERRTFVDRVKREIDSTRKAMGKDASPSLESRRRFSNGGGGRPGGIHNVASYGLRADEEEADNDVDPVQDFEMQHQTILMEQQDRTLTDISGTVGLLREQAKIMGREVVDQNMFVKLLFLFPT